MNITITEIAAKKIRELAEEQEKHNSLLRIGVSPGGCSGYQYAMAFDEKKEGDIALSSNGVEMVTDSLSARILDGVEIDYVDGGGFRIHNPHAKATCGCGHSFEA